MGSSQRIKSKDLMVMLFSSPLVQCKRSTVFDILMGKLLLVARKIQRSISLESRTRFLLVKGKVERPTLQYAL